MKFIATIRGKDVSLAELKSISNRYSCDVSNAEVRKSFCYDLRKWIEDSLDASFSDVNRALDDCRYIISGKTLYSEMAWHRITDFLNRVIAYLPYAQKDDEWPSCKDLLEFSGKDIVERFSDLIKDERIKQNIRTVLKLDDTKDVITAGSLTLYYMELTISIENEILQYPIDVRGNKHRLLFKFSQELYYCQQALIKIGEKNAINKMKEIEEAQRKSEELRKKYDNGKSTNPTTYSTFYSNK